MRRLGRLLSAALLAAVLSSCSTTDTLTPQVDVGRGNPRATTPVTQAEADRMARSAQPETYRGGNSGNGGYRSGPQSTLEAQAQALEAGSATSPASSGPPPQWQGQSQGQSQAQTQSAGRIRGAPPQNLQPPMQEQEPQEEQQPARTTTAPPQQQQQSASLPPAGASAGTIRFLPIIGAPVQAVTPLSRQLGAQARAAGLTIKPSTDTSTEHMLKGYFSAFADGGKVTIVYVWDILDNSGARLNRMQGQEVVAGRGSDPWAAVPASTMETIAAKTIQDYMRWRQSRG